MEVVLQQVKHKKGYEQGGDRAICLLVGMTRSVQILMAAQRYFRPQSTDPVHHLHNLCVVAGDHSR